jgi:hypothetical protein
VRKLSIAIFTATIAESRGAFPVDQLIRKLRIHSLKGKIETSNQLSEALARRFEGAATSGEKTQIRQDYDDALVQKHAQQFLLELLERKEREAASEGMPG